MRCWPPTTQDRIRRRRGAMIAWRKESRLLRSEEVMLEGSCSFTPEYLFVVLVDAEAAPVYGSIIMSYRTRYPSQGV